jgi:hypothetical protein
MYLISGARRPPKIRAHAIADTHPRSSSPAPPTGSFAHPISPSFPSLGERTTKISRELIIGEWDVARPSRASAFHSVKVRWYHKDTGSISIKSARISSPAVIRSHSGPRAVGLRAAAGGWGSSGREGGRRLDTRRIRIAAESRR